MSRVYIRKQMKDYICVNNEKCLDLISNVRVFFFFLRTYYGHIWYVSACLRGGRGSFSYKTLTLFVTGSCRSRKRKLSFSGVRGCLNVSFLSFPCLLLRDPGLFIFRLFSFSFPVFFARTLSTWKFRGTFRATVTQLSHRYKEG